jgi:5-methylthioribose kinase
MMDVNDHDLLKGYLKHNGLAVDESSIWIEPLPGGVSCTVLKIVTDKGRFVLKQALQKLNVKQEWLSDIDRTNVEKRALGFLPSLIPGTTPRLVFDDEPNFVFLMECAPDSSLTWKQMLMAGHCNPVVAEKIGRILGDLHQHSHHNEEAKQLFAEKKYFVQLRIDAFFGFLCHTHPDLQPLIQRHINECLSIETSLVTGDYSPKNILVDGLQVIPIDFEVIHYGDSSFDLGFLSTHLMLKSIYFSERAEDYYEMLRKVLEGYFSVLRFMERSALEQRAVQQLALIMLARVDGKSPVEYITSDTDKQLIRETSRAILHSGIRSYEEVIGYLSNKQKIRS